MDSIDNKILSLLKQGSENQKLDYKRSFDISNKGECIEIIKDIAAMLSSGGGIILIGADGTRTFLQG